MIPNETDQRDAPTNRTVSIRRPASSTSSSTSDLLTSEKEQAELNMIIDLERNDVARICKPGTRQVIQPQDD